MFHLLTNHQLITLLREKIILKTYVVHSGSKIFLKALLRNTKNEIPVTWTKEGQFGAFLVKNILITCLQKKTGHNDYFCNCHSDLKCKLYLLWFSRNIFFSFFLAAWQRKHKILKPYIGCKTLPNPSPKKSGTCSTKLSIDKSFFNGPFPASFSLFSSFRFQCTIGR